MSNYDIQFINELNVIMMQNNINKSINLSTKLFLDNVENLSQDTKDNFIVKLNLLLKQKKQTI